MVSPRTDIPRLGLTGGIGSGKSTALAYLHELGAAVISSDDIVHGLYSGGAVVERGAVSRPALAGVVFADADQLRWLEDLLHPYVRSSVDDWIGRQRKVRPRPALLVVEVPLLFETGFADVFDYTMLITAPDEVRRRRLAAKLTGSEFSRRLAQQMPEEEKIARSDFVFHNTRTRKELKEFVGQTVTHILAAGDDRAAGGGGGEAHA